MSDLPFVSVVIPVWNSPDLIDKCLAALARQTYPRDRFEVIVVDNGSTDGTAEAVKAHPIATLLAEPEPGSYRARNTALRRARGAYVAFTDADCVPDPDWLSAGVAAFREHPEAGVVAGRIELFRADAADSAVAERFERLFSLNQEAYVRQGGAVTANWISPRQVLDAVGGFDARLKSSGDFEMAGRIRAAGNPIVYAPAMLVLHPVRGRVRDILQKRVRIMGGQWTLRREGTPLRRFASEIVIKAMKQSATVLRSSGLTALDRMQLLGVVGASAACTLIELVRLACGGEPRRA